ncbi:GNAT family N-acetyltransferase [Clostridium sp.]|uniref:GNAT family N-acetyltransferase n=1 Tax=Clostridium sp. TaxID=1506 RepID=UPI003520ED98
MIYGDKIYLREILKEDIDEAYNLCSDSEVLKYNGYQYGVSSKKYMVEHLKYLNIPSKRSYVIINKPGTIVGVITYSEDKYSRNVYNISLTIGKKYWRRGYGTDSIKAILKYLFFKRKAHKVELEVVRENEAAVICYKKCGFVEEGIRRKKYYYKGDYLDTIVMGLLKEEFKV